MNTKFSFKNLLVIFIQWLGAVLAFVISLMLSNMISPLSPAISEAGKTATGFLPSGIDFLFNAAVNAAILVWVARRSSFKGLAMIGQLMTLSFVAQVFMTQIETGYFISAFPLLHDNFQLYNLIFRGLITSILFSVLVTLICGGFSKKPRPQAAFQVTAAHTVKQGAWLAAVYVVLYALAGYFIAWQVKDLRLFYSGSSEMVGFFQQWGGTLMTKPEAPFFQYFRGVMWILCLVPLFMGFSGKRAELIVLSAFALALLPTVQLAFANPLMPAAVSLGHFWEIVISNGIFGALCAWFIPKEVPSKSATE
jgi:hypothetical protein